MALRLVLLLCLSFLAQIVAGWTILDDVDAALVYSNSGPAWWAADSLRRQGRYVGSRNSGQPYVTPYRATFHEALGDGASVSLTFTGTRVNLTATICNYKYNTTVDFYLDGEKRSTYTHIVPLNSTSPDQSDTIFLVTLVDLKDLAPAQHVFKAVSVGSDSLFVVDAVSYEASAAVALPSNSTTSAVGIPTLPGPTDISTTSKSTSVSSTTSRSAPASTTTVYEQPVVASMDVPASDPRIIYSPLAAWSQYSSARRSTSCLEGTVSSSAGNSSLTYNFTGTAIQVYTISSPNGGNYTIAIDGQDQGTYSTYDPSADLSACSSRPIFSTLSLPDAQHTLVLTVNEHPSGPNQDTVQFVGIRTPSSATSTSIGTGTTQGMNLGAIIGGVVGGLIGAVLFVLLVMWWMRRQRRNEEDSMAGIAEPTHSDMDATQSQTHWVAARSSASISQMPPQMVQHTYHPAAYPPVGEEEGQQQSSAANDDSMTVERLTYYTLPSYHENVMQRPAARNLSEADVNAISRRLREVMAVQMQQSGGGPQELAGVVPPRELIDHLVQEQLQPPHAL